MAFETLKQTAKNSGPDICQKVALAGALTATALGIVEVGQSIARSPRTPVAAAKTAAELEYKYKLAGDSPQAKFQRQFVTGFTIKEDGMTFSFGSDRLDETQYDTIGGLGCKGFANKELFEKLTMKASTTYDSAHRILTINPSEDIYPALQFSVSIDPMAEIQPANVVTQRMLQKEDACQ